MSSKTVVIGGGTGNFSILTGLKMYKPLALTAIVSMMDDGGSTGILRSEFGILPPGDVRQCMVALSEESELIQRLFQYRFNGSIGEHSFGNLFHLALSRITGSEEDAILEMSKILKISGDVIPVTLENVCLKAMLEDGTLISGESNIDLPKHNPNLKIDRLFIEPPANPNPKALRAIKEAEYIIISPGDLFTSTLPNFLVKGISDAIYASRATLIYVCNLMTKHGETTNFTASDHIRVIHEYLGHPLIDTVIVNKKAPPPKMAKEYAAEKSFPVEYDIESIYAEGVNTVIESNVMSQKTLIRHDPMKISWELIKIVQEQRSSNV